MHFFKWVIEYLLRFAIPSPFLSYFSVPPLPSALSLFACMHIVLRAIILSEMHSPMRFVAEPAQRVAAARARNSRIKVSFRNNAT